jgi:hypothetical protein
MTNNNMWHCADMPPMFSTKWNIDDSSVFLLFFSEFLVFKCILVIHCCFQNKNLYQNYKKKYVISFEKKYFDSLPLKPMGLYLNLLGHFVAY